MGCHQTVHHPVLSVCHNNKYYTGPDGVHVCYFALVFTSKSLIGPMESLPGIKLPTLIVPSPHVKTCSCLYKSPMCGISTVGRGGTSPSCRVLQTSQKRKPSSNLARACNHQYRSTANLLYTTDCTIAIVLVHSCLLALNVCVMFRWWLIRYYLHVIIYNPRFVIMVIR